MLTKYADLEVLEVKRTPKRLNKGAQGERLASFDHLPQETYRTDDGFMYVKVRAISSRVNKNHDGWPASELAGMNPDKFTALVKELDSEDKQKLSRTFTARKLATRGDYGFKTFVGRPIFVDHNNSEPSRTRGVIVDSLLHIEPDRRGKKTSSSEDYWIDPPDNHNPETHIELLLEVDAQAFPKLANAFDKGDIDSVSMGCNVEHTTCSVCGNEAEDTEGYCNHIRNKGSIFFSQKHGKRMKAYEDCYGVNFFEISAVFDPADETALFTGKPISKKAAVGDPLLIMHDDIKNSIYAAQTSLKIGEFDEAFNEVGSAVRAIKDNQLVGDPYEDIIHRLSDAQKQLRAASRGASNTKFLWVKNITRSLDRVLQFLGGEKPKYEQAQQDKRHRDIQDRWDVKPAPPGGRLKWTHVRTGRSFDVNYSPMSMKAENKIFELFEQYWVGSGTDFESRDLHFNLPDDDARAHDIADIIIHILEKYGANPDIMQVNLEGYTMIGDFDPQINKSDQDMFPGIKMTKWKTSAYPTDPQQLADFIEDHMMQVGNAGMNYNNEAQDLLQALMNELDEGTIRAAVDLLRELVGVRPNGKTLLGPLIDIGQRYYRQKQDANIFRDFAGQGKNLLSTKMPPAKYLMDKRQPEEPPVIDEDEEFLKELRRKHVEERTPKPKRNLKWQLSPGR